MGLYSSMFDRAGTQAFIEARKKEAAALLAQQPSVAEWAKTRVAEVMDRLSSREADLAGLLAETKAELAEVSRQLSALRQATGELTLARAGEEIEEELERMMEESDGAGQEISLPSAR